MDRKIHIFGVKSCFPMVGLCMPYKGFFFRLKKIKFDTVSIILGIRPIQYETGEQGFQKNKTKLGLFHQIWSNTGFYDSNTYSIYLQ